jgi:DNA-binding LacI/PurR family transcriptional regulator
MAFAAIDVARREFGLNVGTDLSIVGVDDVTEAAHAAYDLTTFAQPPAALAEATIAIIDAFMVDPETEAARREVPGELIVRGSARLPSQGIVQHHDNRIWRG